MIAQELEVSLHMAFVEARQQRHEFITVEHLLMALDRAADDLEAHVPQAQVWRDLSRAFMNLGVVDYELGPRRWRVLKSQSGRRVIDLPVALR